MRNALLLALGSILLVGWAFTPGKQGKALLAGAVEMAAGSNTANASSKRDEEDRRLANYYAGTTEIDRARDGHFYADVEANGVKIATVVDTGATVVALTGEDARAAGYSWSPGDVRVVGSGASGPVRGIPITLDRVALGGHEATHVPAVIIPEGLEMSLLGQSFLSTIDPMRIEGDRMLLGG